MEDEKMEDEDTLDDEGSVKNWFQDNLRIIISIIIVIAIAAGVYSYSKRAQAPSNEQTATTSEEQAAQNQETPANTNEQGQAAEGVQPEQPEASKPAQNQQVTSTATSTETETAFVEAAGSGDGVTKLARRALANYLEKNPDSSLTPEHKIYIEDYLRKKSGFHGRVFIGTSVEFSKDLISQAIGQSKNLNQNQLSNLHKYAVRVPSLS